MLNAWAGTARFIGRILGAATLPFAVACADLRGEPDLEPVVEDSAGVAIVTQPGPAVEVETPFVLASEPSIRLGALDGTEEEQFSRVTGAVSLGDGAIAVMDATAREIRVFDRDGTFRHRIGRSGDGPGEFRLPQQLLRLAGDTLLAWDSGHGRLAWFDAAGALIREQVVSGRNGIGRVGSVHPFPDGSVALAEVGSPPGGGADLERYREEVTLLQWEGEDRFRRWAVVEGVEMWRSVEESSGGMTMVALGRQWYGPAHHLAVAGSLLWRSDGTEWRLEGWDPVGGEVVREVRIDRPPVPFDDAFIRSLHEAEAERAEDPEALRRLRLRQAAREYPELVPPIRTLRGGADGRIWIGFSEQPPVTLPAGGGMELHEWLVIEEDGTVVGRIRLPPRSRLAWADEDHVLLVHYDELDLPFVERWDFEERATARDP